MAAKQIEVMFGAMERPNAALVDTLLTNPLLCKYIQGVEFHWAGKDAIGNIHINSAIKTLSDRTYH